MEERKRERVRKVEEGGRGGDDKPDRKRARGSPREQDEGGGWMQRTAHRAPPPSAGKVPVQMQMNECQRETIGQGATG